jgi:hypothetical protein
VSINIQGGTLTGIGTITGSVTTATGAGAGQVSPGLSPGILNITGTYTQGAAGALNIELGGTTPGNNANNHDQLNVSGAATLSGVLNVSLVNGFTPAAGDTFTIMNYGSHSGTFTTVNLPALDEGLTWNVNYNATTVILSIPSQVAFFTSSTTIGSDSKLNWDNVLKRLGIGTSNILSRLLHLKGNVCLFERNVNSAGFIIERNGPDVTGYNRWVFGVDEPTGFVIKTYPWDSATAVEQLTITKDDPNTPANESKVGIGTTSPTAKLDVAGDVHVSGSLTLGGNKNFVVPDPSDPSKEIYYAALEGPEAGTYLRGSAELVNGIVTIDLPQHFTDVTSDKGLTVQLTPVGKGLQLYVIEKTTTKLVVGEATGLSGSFDYIVNGIRKGYEDYQVIRDASAKPAADTKVAQTNLISVP